VSERIGERLAATARRRDAHAALVGAGGVVSYRELTRRVTERAAAFARAGLAPARHLAVSLPNGPDFVVAVLAGLALDATVAPLDPLLTPEETDAILADLGPTLVVRGSGVERGAGRAEVAAPGAACALILYTSGSTGRPKGARLSQRALDLALDSWAGPVLDLRPDDVVLAALPLSHSFGLNGALLAPLLTGATVVLVERFSPEAVLDAMIAYGVTVFPGVATMFRRLLDHPGLRAADLVTLRLAVSGAAPCPWELADEWRRRVGVRIVRGYGMTELFRPISYRAREDDDRPDSIGRPVPGVDVQIVAEDGTSLPPGEIGELWIRTPAAMDGYLDAPHDTRAVLRDGWFLTGDLATVSADGFVRIAGRKRERILRGGYSIFPSEVEAALLAHPAVAEAAVLGRTHPELGEEIAAFVVLQAGATADAATLTAWCRERLASFKYPREITLLPALPKSATGKVLKSRLGGSTG
jgi:long-chain acyl-CoA synthetase